MIKAALFDLDGVVFDTEPQYTFFWEQMGRKYHLGISDFAKKIKGQTLQRIFSDYFNDVKDQQPHIVSLLNDFEKNLSFDYVPGFLEFVSELRCKGVKTAIVTSSNQDKMQSLYAARPEIKGLFDKILTAEDFKNSKPSPECYLKGAEALSVQPDECVGFEDSFNGLKAVRAAGMYVVGLSTTNSEAVIRDYCDVVINDYKNWTHKIHLFI